MKRVMVLFLFILLSGCKEVTVYDIDEILLTPQFEEVDIQNGFSIKSNEESNLTFAISEAVSMTEDGVEKEYIRYIWFNRRTYDVTINIIEAIYNQFDELKEKFDNPNDIYSIFLNAETGLIYILPEEVDEYTSENTIVINYNVIYPESEIDKYMELHGVNLRDLLLPVLELEYTESNLVGLINYLRGAAIALKHPSILFVDVVTEIENNKTYFYDTLNSSYPQLGGTGQETSPETIKMEYYQNEEGDLLVYSEEPFVLYIQKTP